MHAVAMLALGWSKAHAFDHVLVLINISAPAMTPCTRAGQLRFPRARGMTPHILMDL